MKNPKTTDLDRWLDKHVADAILTHEGNEDWNEEQRLTLRQVGFSVAAEMWAQMRRAMLHTATPTQASMWARLAKSLDLLANDAVFRLDTLD